VHPPQGTDRPVEAAQVGPDRQGAAGQGRADPDLLTACHTTTLA
jgi:hypothetical protein